MRLKHVALIFAIALSTLISTASADNYLIVCKEGKVFDEPNSKGYVTLNQSNQEVSFLPGMVFKDLEKRQGWSLVEYSPGLRGFISDQVTAEKTVTPKAGTYKIQNSPSKQLKVYNTGDVWTATVDNQTFNGKKFNNVVVFFDDKNNQRYSLVDLGNGPVAMSYDYNITRFF